LFTPDSSLLVDRIAIFSLLDLFGVIANLHSFKKRWFQHTAEFATRNFFLVAPCGTCPPKFLLMQNFGGVTNFRRVKATAPVKLPTRHCLDDTLEKGEQSLVHRY